MGTRLVLALSLLAALGSSLMQTSYTEDGCITADVCDVEDDPEKECSLFEDGWMMPDNHHYYQIRPLKLGVEIRGISLHTNHSSAVIEQIKQDIFRYRLLVFRDQGVLSPDRQVVITSWLGEPDPSNYGEHNPNEFIVRVANDKKEGVYGAGSAGFHIDGTYRAKPLAFSLYHGINVTYAGDTEFAPMTEIVEMMAPEIREFMETIWVHRNTEQTRPFNPLIYTHPNTSEPVIYVHAGTNKEYVWHYGTKHARRASAEEKKKLFMYTDGLFETDGGKYIYSHKWQPGDFVITDNLALVHRPSSAAIKEKRVDAGLRVLHRSQVMGSVYPARRYAVPFDPPSHGKVSEWKEGLRRLYWTRNFPFALEIGGISLLDDPSLELIHELEMDLIRHHILIFHRQDIDNARQMAITSWFGRLQKVQGNETESAETFITSEKMTGDTWWQSDGTNEETPYPYKFMRLADNPGQTNIFTEFIGLRQMVENLDIDTRASWERLWLAQSRGRAHPLIYAHPFSSAPVFYAFGKNERMLIRDYDGHDPRPVGDKETRDILHEIDEQFSKVKKGRFKWSAGDFIMIDNRAIAHRTVVDSSPKNYTNAPEISCSYVQGIVHTSKRYYDNRHIFADKVDKADKKS